MCISAMMQLYFPKHHRSFQRKTITDDALRLLAEAATLRMLQTKKECEKREGNKEGKGREGKGREGKGSAGKEPFGVNLMRSQVSYRTAQEGE